MTLGTYPEISLVEAREEKTAARRLIQLGHGPITNAREAERERKASAANTFYRVGLEWLDVKSYDPIAFITFETTKKNYGGIYSLSQALSR